MQTEHLLLALLRQKEAPGIIELQSLNVDLEHLSRGLSKNLQPASHGKPEEVQFSTALTKVLTEMVVREAKLLGTNYIGTEHVLLSLLREHGGPIELAITELGHEIDALYRGVFLLLGGGLT